MPVSSRSILMNRFVKGDATLLILRTYSVYTAFLSSNDCVENFMSVYQPFDKKSEHAMKVLLASDWFPIAKGKTVEEAQQNLLAKISQHCNDTPVDNFPDPKWCQLSDAISHDIELIFNALKRASSKSIRKSWEFSTYASIDICAFDAWIEELRKEEQARRTKYVPSFEMSPVMNCPNRASSLH